MRECILGLVAGRAPVQNRSATLAMQNKHVYAQSSLRRSAAMSGENSHEANKVLKHPRSSTVQIRTRTHSNRLKQLSVLS